MQTVEIKLNPIYRYGIRVNPMAWINAIYGQYHKDGEFPIFWMLACKYFILVHNFKAIRISLKKNP